jgi:arylsulfatase A-like enzyme
MFNNSFLSFPLCCPSRATFLPGQYPQNHGVLSNNALRSGYDTLNYSNALPLWLREAGYYTAHVGKHLNEHGEGDPTEVPPDWDNWQGVTHSFKNYGYKLNGNGDPIRRQGSRLSDGRVSTLGGAGDFHGITRRHFSSVSLPSPHALELNEGHLSCAQSGRCRKPM